VYASTRLGGAFGSLEMTSTMFSTKQTQIWIAISAYVPVVIIKKELNLELSLSEILQILSVTLFGKVPITQVSTKTMLQNVFFDFITNCYCLTYNGTVVI